MTNQIQTATTSSPLTTELLILPDGRVLVHNLTQPFAELLRELNPGDEQISPRVKTNVRPGPHRSPAKNQNPRQARRLTYIHELPD
jgi:hypothetical protein